MGVSSPARYSYRVASVARNYLLPWLGLTDRQPIVARWLRSGYAIRNRVVHEGEAMSLAQAKEALEAAEAFSMEVDDRLAANVGRTPRTAARKLGKSLLDRVTADDALRAIVEEETAGPLFVGVVPPRN